MSSKRSTDRHYHCDMASYDLKTLRTEMTRDIEQSKMTSWWNMYHFPTHVLTVAQNLDWQNEGMDLSEVSVFYRSTVPRLQSFIVQAKAKDKDHARTPGNK